jgi:hypothetical protein
VEQADEGLRKYHDTRQQVRSYLRDVDQAFSQCLKDGKGNPNALCNSVCNGGGGILCGGPSYAVGDHEQ